MLTTPRRCAIIFTQGTSGSDASALIPMDVQESTESKDPVLFYAAELVEGFSLPPFPFPAAPLGLWGKRRVRDPLRRGRGLHARNPQTCQKQQKSPAFAAKTPPTPQNLIILLRSLIITVRM